jgi:tetratricopeptide (TPR) repeat protein
MGHLFTDHHQLEAAQDSYEKAIRIQIRLFKVSLPSDSPERLTIEQALLICTKKWETPPPAKDPFAAYPLPYYERFEETQLDALTNRFGLIPKANLEAALAAKGMHHPALAPQLANIASISFRQGKYSEAMELFERVLRIADPPYGRACASRDAAAIAVHAAGFAEGAAMSAAQAKKFDEDEDEDEEGEDRVDAKKAATQQAATDAEEDPVPQKACAACFELNVALQETCLSCNKPTMLKSTLLSAEESMQLSDGARKEMQATMEKQKEVETREKEAHAEDEAKEKASLEAYEKLGQEIQQLKITEEREAHDLVEKENKEARDIAEKEKKLPAAERDKKAVERRVAKRKADAESMKADKEREEADLQQRHAAENARRTTADPPQPEVSFVDWKAGRTEEMLWTVHPEYAPWERPAKDWAWRNIKAGAKVTNPQCALTLYCIGQLYSITGAYNRKSSGRLAHASPVEKASRMQTPICGAQANCLTCSIAKYQLVDAAPHACQVTAKLDLQKKFAIVMGLKNHNQARELLYAMKEQHHHAQLRAHPG